MGILNPHPLYYKIMKTKTCTGCGKVKKLFEFHKDKKGKFRKQAHCKLCNSLKNKKYYVEHKNKIKKQSKNYRESHLKYYKIYNKEYGQKSENKIRRNNHQKIRYDTDINFKITITLRNRVWDVLNRKPKNKRTLELLGCTLEELKIHLQSQFTSGMTWDNHGKGKNKWNIDHIIPCNSFDLSDFKQQELCFHYTNLQPLWSLDNIRKSDKILN